MLPNFQRHSHSRTLKLRRGGGKRTRLREITGRFWVLGLLFSEEPGQGDNVRVDLLGLGHAVAAGGHDVGLVVLDVYGGSTGENCCTNGRTWRMENQERKERKTVEEGRKGTRRS